MLVEWPDDKKRLYEVLQAFSLLNGMTVQEGLVRVVQMNLWAASDGVGELDRLMKEAVGNPDKES